MAAKTCVCSDCTRPCKQPQDLTTDTRCGLCRTGLHERGDKFTKAYVPGLG